MDASAAVVVPSAEAEASDDFAARRPGARRLRRVMLGYPGWVLLNVLVLAAVLLLNLLSSSLLGLPQMRGACWLIAGGVVLLGALWLAMIVGPARVAPDAVCRRLAQFAGGVSLVLAVLVSRTSPVGDVPGAIIALPPLVAVAFHHRASYAAGLAIVLGLLTLLPLRGFVRAGQPAQLAAAFNAAGLALAGVIVALVVSLLTAALRRETARLRNSLEELRATRTQLVAKEKLAAIGRLSAAIAHEIRNPVAMIVSSLELAARNTTPVETREEMASIAREEAGRLTRLTGDFLAYARGNPPVPRETSVGDLVEYVAALVKARAAEAGVTVGTELPPELKAPLDDRQVHLAALNLTANALDATPAGGTVTIGAAAPAGDADTFELFVENTGDPIPPEDADRLFEPFFTTKPQGTGLGLAIARRIVDAHGGELYLARNEPGRVRFAMRLPRRQLTSGTTSTRTAANPADGRT